MGRPTDGVPREADGPVSDENVKDLVRGLRFAQWVAAALPVDDEADRIVADLMRRNRKPATKIRLLKRKAAP